MKRKLLFLVSVFAATAALMALQKPFFLARYVAGEGFGAADWRQVVWHGLPLDFTVAGYVTALPLLAVFASLWCRIPERAARWALNAYFAVVAVVSAAIFAVDLALYEHWGFRIDSTVLIYLADPQEALASVDFWLGVRQTGLFVLFAAAMIGVYRLVVRLFDGRPLRWCVALPWSAGMVLLAGLDFLAIRGGVQVSVANVSKVYFSSEMVLNHAAVNPVFSFLSSLGRKTDFASEYPFFDEETRARNFEALRGNRPDAVPAVQVVNGRPNVVIVILESFARTVMEAEVDGEPVMPNMRRLRSEGVWFENFFANSFRTDRGEVAILSGFPAQTLTSIMKLPAKSRNLPSVARSLAREGYATRFVYGGDLNFTDQSSYMYATGWQELRWLKDFTFDAPTSKWGYDDRVMCNWFGEQVVAWSAEAEESGRPFLAGLLTLSSHAPFEVPYEKFADRELNAMAFADECVGRMVDGWKASPAWDDLLVVLVADHGFPYPKTLAYNEPLRHRIPMIWLGGALATPPRTVDGYASQIDFCATLLGQLGVVHDDFEYSKDIFAPALPKFAYYTFNNGFGVVDASGHAIYDAASGQPLAETAPGLLDIGRTMLQTTYVDIARR